MMNVHSVTVPVLKKWVIQNEADKKLVTLIVGHFTLK